MSNYEMIPVKEQTKENLKEIKKKLNNPSWDTIVNDFIDILEKDGVEERGDLIRLKTQIMRWLENGKKE